MSWAELFGDSLSEFTGVERRERWEKWKELCRQGDPKRADRIIAGWEDVSACCEGGQCKHLDLNGARCKEMDLPCTINPILTIRGGMMGMACMGLGYQVDHKPEKE